MIAFDALCDRYDFSRNAVPAPSWVQIGPVRIRLDDTNVQLHAQPEGPLDVRFEIAGHRLMVRSVDLAQDWQGIHRVVLAVPGHAEEWAALAVGVQSNQ